MLDTLVNPNVVYLILIGAIWAVALALIIPGTGVAEAAAATLLGLAALGLTRIPVNPGGVALMLIGLALFIVEFRWPKRGLFLAAAGLALAAGSIFLFSATGSAAPVSPWLAVAATSITVGYFWIALRFALAAQRKPPMTGAESLEGSRGEARTEINPAGTVFVGGELWSAESDEAIRPGEAVVVMKRHGLKLIVAKAGKQ